MKSHEQDNFIRRYMLQRLSDLKEITKKVRNPVPKLKKVELTDVQKKAFGKLGISLGDINKLRKMSVTNK